MATQTLTADLGPAGTALHLPLAAAILKLMPQADREREMQLMDEAEVAWLDNALAALEAEAGPPPF